MTALKPCPFCGNMPRMYFADDEGTEIDMDYARYNGECDPNDESSIKNWLDENIDVIAYFAVVSCSCGVNLWGYTGATKEELSSNAIKIWNTRAKVVE